MPSPLVVCMHLRCCRTEAFPRTQVHVYTCMKCAMHARASDALERCAATCRLHARHGKTRAALTFKEFCRESSTHLQRAWCTFLVQIRTWCSFLKLCIRGSTDLHKFLHPEQHPRSESFADHMHRMAYQGHHPPSDNFAERAAPTFTI